MLGKGFGTVPQSFRIHFLCSDGWMNLSHIFFEGLREVGDSSCNELGELQNPCLVKSWLTAHFFRWTSQLLSLKRKIYKNCSPNLDLFSASRSDDRLGTRSRQKLCFLLYLYVHMVATGNKWRRKSKSIKRIKTPRKHVILARQKANQSTSSGCWAKLWHPHGFKNPETPDGEDLQIPHSASLTSPEAVDERWLPHIGWARI